MILMGVAPHLQSESTHAMGTPFEVSSDCGEEQATGAGNSLAMSFSVMIEAISVG
jgi:hypothetical protein